MTETQQIALSMASEEIIVDKVFDLDGEKENLKKEVKFSKDVKPAVSNSTATDYATPKKRRVMTTKCESLSAKFHTSKGSKFS